MPVAGRVVRVGINLGNALLAGRAPATGALHGIAVDLACELGERLGASIDLVPFQTAAQMADAATADAWDVAFLAADPARAGDISFTAPYLEIEATYLVPPGSAIGAIEAVDRPGVRIAVADKSAYDLALRRSVTRAAIVPADGVNASVHLFFAERLEVLAGLRPLLVNVAAAHAGCRVLDGRFTAVLQAIGTPKGREVAGLEAFVQYARTSGLVSRLIDKHQVEGVTAVP
jgi:polar amino acid transport system substrate-binding protein